MASSGSRGLGKSASEPSLVKSSPSLRAAAQLAGTTTLYESLKAENKFRDGFAQVYPAGKSINVPLADSAARDVQPEIYFPLPHTPISEKRFRKISHAPGEIHVHHGLKEQRLPHEDFRYGMRGVKGATTEDTMKAGLKFGVAEYKHSVAEMVYESSKKEPLGRSFNRGHELKMNPQGFGKIPAEVESAKPIIFPGTSQPGVTFELKLENMSPDKLKDDTALALSIQTAVKVAVASDAGCMDKHVETVLADGSPGLLVDIRILPSGGITSEEVYSRLDGVNIAETVELKVKKIYGIESVADGEISAVMTKPPWMGALMPVVESEEAHARYVRTHNSYKPGERINRGYNWPEETKDNNFRFGGQVANAVEGVGARMALNLDVEDNGQYKQTRLVQRVNEDYRHVQHPKLFASAHQKQGANGPPIDPEHRFGIKSTISDYTAKSCIKGYYPLKEQLPDQDLGRCTKPGRRNVTTEERAFGIPSVRTDVAGPPPGKRSIADTMSYGDECSAAALLNPQRFDDRGVADREFLVRRPKEELEELVAGVNLSTVDLESIWPKAVALFDDGLPLVSLDALLYVHSNHLDEHVQNRHKGSSPGALASVGKA